MKFRTMKSWGILFTLVLVLGLLQGTTLAAIAEENNTVAMIGNQASCIIQSVRDDYTERG